MDLFKENREIKKRDNTEHWKVWEESRIKN